eukprot:jgi/Chrzof1/15027/Cz09g24140.t1
MLQHRHSHATATVATYQSVNTIISEHLGFNPYNEPACRASKLFPSYTCADWLDAWRKCKLVFNHSVHQ